MQRGIANILHRDTIAVIVGSKTFERGEACFTAQRVQSAGRGELRGVVRPNEAGRAPYIVRIWVREEGLAYECTCPIGVTRQFCKHTVAIALAHLDNQRIEIERGIGVLREALAAIAPPALIEGLVGLARRDPEMSDTLKRMCLDVLSKQ